MAKFDYNRKRISFIAGSDFKTPDQKRGEISFKINEFLDSYGADDWELVYYNELLREEGTVHITTVFKKRISTSKVL